MKTFKLRHEIQDIPDAENGVYWFKLRFPNAYALGIYSSNFKLNCLVDAIESFSNIVNQLKIKNRIYTKNSLMLLRAFNIDISSHILASQNKKIRDLLRFKSRDEIKSIVDLLKFAVDELPPVYVGITDRQSFKERFDQHFYGETSLLDGITGLGIGWDNLNFTVFPKHVHNILNSRDVERLFHLILKPTISKR